MKARARVVVAVVGGRTLPVVLRSVPPLVVRATPDATYLVGGAAGPLGGDDLTLDINVGPGAELVMRTAAASIALPGPHGTPSRLTINARVADGASLRWLPEPSVAAARCNHSVDVQLTLDGTARALWRDELMLGRHGERPGTWCSRLWVERNGSPILRHGIHIGPDASEWAGPAVIDGARAIGSLLVADQESLPAAHLIADRAASFPLAAGGVLVTALAANAIDLRSILDEAHNAATKMRTPSRRLRLTLSVCRGPRSW